MYKEKSLKVTNGNQKRTDNTIAQGPAWFRYPKIMRKYTQINRCTLLYWLSFCPSLKGNKSHKNGIEKSARKREFATTSI